MKIVLSSSFFRLVAFSTAVAVLPLLCVLLVIGFMRSSQAFDIVDARMRNFMLALEMQQEEINLTTRTLLESLAETTEVKARDLEVCAGLFRRLQDKINIYANFALYDADGTLMVAATEGISGAQKHLPLEFLRGERKLEREASEAPNTVVSEFETELFRLKGKFNIFLNEHSLVFIYTLRDVSGRGSGFLAAFMDIYQQRGRIARLGLPPGFVVHFLDSKVRRVLQIAADPKYVEIPPHVEATILNHRDNSESRLIDIKNESGDTFLFTFAGLRISALSEPYIYIALSVNDVFAYVDIRSGIMYSLGSVIVGVGGTLVLLWVLCSFVFKKPAARLLDIAKKLGQGDFAARQALPSQTHGAFKDFSASLFHLAEALEKNETEICQASAKAKQAGQAKSEFLANMSHEIRTPLNAILGMTYLVLKSNLSAGQRGYVNKIQVASKNLLHVINDILDYSKMEAGKMDMEQIRFAVRDLFSNLAAHYTSRAQESGIQFEMSIATDVPMYLVGDPLRLEQAVGQLLENAFRHTWKGFVRLSCSPGGIVHSECALRITVSDTGEGLSPEELADLREAFSSKNHTDDTKRFSGESSKTGPILGLAIAQRLFEYMNGYIEVNSEAGRGSTYTCVARFVYREDDQTRHSIILAGKSILIADSDEISLVLYSSMLSNFSISCKGFASAAEALAELARADGAGEGYDYFMLDLRNLEENTASILGKIKLEMSLVKIPRILALSDTGRESARKYAESAGVDAFLHKPVDASVLLDTLMGLCSGSEISAMGRAVAEAIAKMPKQTLDGLNVLLVEDNALNQQLAQEFMSSQGISVTIAGTGKQALTAIAEHPATALNQENRPFDIALMDLQMPEMDGFEATWRIRNDSHLQSSYIPIIAMTAHSNPAEINACRKAGMDDYVGKPIDINLFFEALRRWLPILPDAQNLIAADFKNLLELIRAKEPRALAMFASLQEALTFFIGEGRLKKLQKMLWDNTWAEANSFASYLNDCLYQQGRAAAAAAPSAQAEPYISPGTSPGILLDTSPDTSPGTSPGTLPDALPAASYADKGASAVHSVPSELSKSGESSKPDKLSKEENA